VIIQFTLLLEIKRCFVAHLVHIASVKYWQWLLQYSARGGWGIQLII